MSEKIISLENIYKSFGGVTVLDNVSFALEKGTVHALVGGNGAGKSTLMKIMTGVYTADNGTIKMGNERVRINNYLDAQKYGIRMIFQELSLSPTLTVSENIFLAQEKKKWIFSDKKRMRSEAAKLLARLELDIDPDEKVQNLDVGVCQLVEIAKALSMDPSVLVMDEPTASLTEREVSNLFNIIDKLKSDGVSIVYISHRMKEIFQIADKITVLRDGVVVSEKPIDGYTMESLVRDLIGQDSNIITRSSEKPMADDAPFILEVENFSFDNKLKDISFNLRRGEVLGFAGLMGTGRTETLETLFGLNQQGKTIIKIDGKEVKINNVRDAVKQGIALIPEDRRRCGLVLEHSVKDNISLPNFKRLTKFKFISKKMTKNMVSDSIKNFNIKTDSMSKLLINLSGGNQQKVVVAKWLNTKPRILLMDEPTAGVDIGAKSEIMEIVRKFTSEGNSVILVSSELIELLSICDRVLVFSKNKISMEYTSEKLKVDGEEILQHAIQN